MKINKVKYTLDLKDKQDLERIKKLFDNYFGILKIMTEDSKNALDGGGMPNYIVNIEIKEDWV